jgi:negative regulator of flagellin synthesis FlgM
MKVETKSTAIQLDAYLRQVQEKKSANAQQNITARLAQTDKVNLSERAMEVQQAAQALKQMPAVRDEKVHQVKAAVEKGTYHVNGARVAKNMLNEAFENSMILNTIDRML